jgi:sorbitol/mannitol transport system substrate-binding protein
MYAYNLFMRDTLIKIGCIALLGVAFLSGCSHSDQNKIQTVNIAIVNNPDLIRLKSLSAVFQAEHPDIQLRWLTLEENMLRQRVTVDVAAQSGQFDVVSLGSYEIPMWARHGWLKQIDNPRAKAQSDDYLQSIKKLVTYQDRLYAVPFYGESSFTMYRKDLFALHGLHMPEAPTWDFIETAAKQLNQPSAGVYGICLRGKAGWGENVALLTAMSNSFGARLFDMDWHPQFTTPEWQRTLSTYVRLVRNYGPPGSSVNGFSENLALFSSGRCGIWVDSTVAGSFVTNPTTSAVANKVGFAFAPDAGLGKKANWLFAWSLAIPGGSRQSQAAQEFIAWATSPEYTRLVAQKYGWAAVPPGTSKSLYANPEYQKNVPFSAMTLKSIEEADPLHPTVKPVPYVGIQFATIPEFQGIGAEAGRQFAAAAAGVESPEMALTRIQAHTEQEMTDEGYIK